MGAPRLVSADSDSGKLPDVVESYAKQANDNLANTRFSGSAFSLGRTIYTKAQGALADGTTNDTVAIKAAITAAGTGGTIIFDGISVIDSTLTPRPDQTWMFRPGAQLKAAAGAAFNMVQSTLVAGAFTTDGMFLDGNKANVTGATDTVGIGLYISAARPDRPTRLSNVTVVNSSSHGIRALAPSLAAAYPIEIQSAYVTGATRIGINLRYVRAIVDRCTVTAGGAEGIYFNQCDGSKCINTTASQNVWHGIVFVYSSAFQVMGNTAVGNGTVSGGNAAACGIAIGGGTVGLPVNNHYAVIGNTCDGNQAVGIQIDPTITGQTSAKQVQHATVVGNSCNGNVLNHGIYVQNGSYIALSGNSCSGNGKDGMLINGAYCAIGDNELGANARYGLNLPDDTGGGYHRVGANMLLGNTSARMYVGPTLVDVQMVSLATAPTGATV